MNNSSHDTDARSAAQSDRTRHARRCPHCGKDGVLYLKKLSSDSGNPVTCAFCGNLSYVPDTVGNGIFVIGFLLLIFSAIFAFATKSWLHALLGVAVSMTVYGLLWHVVSMRPTTKEQVAIARRLSWITLIVSIFPSLFS